MWDYKLKIREVDARSERSQTVIIEPGITLNNQKLLPIELCWCAATSCKTFVNLPHVRNMQHLFWACTLAVWRPEAMNECDVRVTVITSQEITHTFPLCHAPNLCTFPRRGGREVFWCQMYIEAPQSKSTVEMDAISVSAALHTVTP